MGLVDVNLELFISFSITLVLYPIVCCFISSNLKKLIVTIKTNKDLIHTIQTILQVFPEGVIIRSLDETSMKTVMKFSNNIAKKDLVTDVNDYENDENQTVKIKVVDSQSFNEGNENELILEVNEFLKLQEDKFILQDTE